MTCPRCAGGARRVGGLPKRWQNEIPPQTRSLLHWRPTPPKPQTRARTKPRLDILLSQASLARCAEQPQTSTLQRKSRIVASCGLLRCCQGQDEKATLPRGKTPGSNKLDARMILMPPQAKPKQARCPRKLSPLRPRQEDVSATATNPPF